jgi:hypothetical protein
MEPDVETTIVTLGSRDLAVSPEQVARCAGGTRYRMEPSQRLHVGSTLERAYELVAPAFVYCVHEVVGFLEGEYVKLRDGLTFPVPSGACDNGTKALAFCVCTIGPRLEEAERSLMSAGDALGGLFLHATGVAFLETLSSWAHETLQERARDRLLQTGCRCGPGYGGLDLSCQKRLFDLVDASSIGVRLNESGMMIPAKSVSFVTRLTTSRVPQGSPNKCASCSLPHCAYRL